jgi:hypothetical protein
MKHYSTSGRALAIVAGVAFTYGGLRIILGDTLTDPSKWTTSVQLTVLMVFGTIAAGHLMRDAARSRHLFAALGFLVLFLAGTGLVVFNSVGRQAEATMLTVSQADDAAERRVAVKAALARAEAMLATAQADLARECKTGRGRRCEGIQATIAVYEAATRGHKADLEKIGPPKPVNAKAAEGAKIAALFGADEAKAKAALLLLEPFLWTLFYEVGSIVSLGFAFGHRPTVRQSIRPSDQTPDVSEATRQTASPEAQATNVLAFIRPTESNDDDPTTPTKRPRTWKRDEVIADLVGRLERREQFPSQRTLAAFYGVPTSTLSDWLRDAEAEGVLHRIKEGRRKAVAAG